MMPTVKIIKKKISMNKTCGTWEGLYIMHVRPKAPKKKKSCNIVFFLEGIYSNLQIMTQRIIETLSYALTHTACFRCYTVSRD